MEKSIVVGAPDNQRNTGIQYIVVFWITKIFHEKITKKFASESRKFFKWLFYLKQINFITGGPLESESPGQLPPLPPLNPALAEVPGFVVFVTHFAVASGAARIFDRGSRKEDIHNKNLCSAGIHQKEMYQRIDSRACSIDETFKSTCLLFMDWHIINILYLTWRRTQQFSPESLFWTNTLCASKHWNEFSCSPIRAEPGENWSTLPL